jgi:hypothetical protein
MKPRNALLMLALTAVVLCATGSLAQTMISGDLTGTVTDATNAVVANAQVSLTSKDFGTTSDTTTSQSGLFRFSNLRPGDYTVTVKAQGFAPVSRDAVISLGKETSVAFQLSVKGASEKVEVTTEAPLLETESINLTQNFNTVTIAALPSPGQDITNYALMTPGVALSTGAGYGNFTTNGLGGTSNLYTINGGDMNDPYNNLNNSGSSNNMLGVNEIQEVTIVTNGYTGQYGRAAGVNETITTKSGTNAFHGNANWWWNGYNLNANDWFQNNAGTPRGFANSNQYAGSIGGPIKKDKLWFFFDDEGMRYVLFAPANVYVPSPQFQQATLLNLGNNFAGADLATEKAWYQNMFNIYNGANGIGRAVPVSAGADPQLGCGDLTGTPTGLAGGGTFGVDTPCALNFRGGNNNKNTENLFAIRVDWAVNDKNKLAFRYWQDNGNQPTFTDPINPVFNAASNQPQWAGQATWNQTINNHMVNQLIVGGMYYSAIFKVANPTAAEAVFPTTLRCLADCYFTNLGGTQFNYTQGRRVSQAQVIDDFSWVKGNHNLKFGGNIRQNDITAVPYNNLIGNLQLFSTTELFNGDASRLSQRFTQVHSAPMQYYSLGLYGQDEWRVNQKLTLTLALRMDRNSNEECKTNCFSRFRGGFQGVDPTSTYTDSILVHQQHAYNSMQAVIFEPRIGVNYNLYPNTVLRGGFGMFSDLYQGLMAQRFATNAPFVASFNTPAGPMAQGVPDSVWNAATVSNQALLQGYANNWTLAQIAAYARQNGGRFTAPTFNASNTNMSYPVYFKWNFEIEQQLKQNTVLSLNYVGTHGYNEILQNPDLNTADPSGTLPGLPLVRPNLNFSTLTQLTNSGYSNYNGLTATLTQRFFQGFSGQISFTWSHSLDTVSNGGLAAYSFIGDGDSFLFQIDPRNLALNYGNSDYDFRRLLNGSYTWQLPFKSSNKIANLAVAGWQYSGVLHWRSAQPYSVYDSYWPGALSGGASSVVLGSYISGALPSCGYPGTNSANPHLCQNVNNWVPSGSETTWGSTARNSFRGPSYFDWDMTVTKAFKLTERMNLTFGMNFYNIFNHANFGNPDADVSSGTFGQILSTVTPASSPYGNFQGAAVSGRVIQTVAKFNF